MFITGDLSDIIGSPLIGPAASTPIASTTTVVDFQSPEKPEDVVTLKPVGFPRRRKLAKSSERYALKAHKRAYSLSGCIEPATHNAVEANHPCQGGDQEIATGTKLLQIKVKNCGGEVQEEIEEVEVSSGAKVVW